MSDRNEEILKLVQDKMTEKNEVIREQQLQIQELQQKVSDLEQQVEEANAKASASEELYNKISEIVE